MSRKKQQLVREARDWFDTLELPTKHSLVVARMGYFDDWREDAGEYSDLEQAEMSSVRCSLLRWQRRVAVRVGRRAQCAYRVSLGEQQHSTARMHRLLRLWKHLHYGKQEAAAEMELAVGAAGDIHGVLQVRIRMSLLYWALRARVRVRGKLGVFRAWRCRSFGRLLARQFCSLRGRLLLADGLVRWRRRARWTLVAQQREVWMLAVAVRALRLWRVRCRIRSTEHALAERQFLRSFWARLLCNTLQVRGMGRRQAMGGAVFALKSISAALRIWRLHLRTRFIITDAVQGRIEEFRTNLLHSRLDLWRHRARERRAGRRRVLRAQRLLASKLLRRFAEACQMRKRQRASQGVLLPECQPAILEMEMEHGVEIEMGLGLVNVDYSAGNGSFVSSGGEVGEVVWGAGSGSETRKHSMRRSPAESPAHTNAHTHAHTHTLARASAEADAQWASADESGLSLSSLHLELHSPARRLILDPSRALVFALFRGRLMRRSSLLPRWGRATASLCGQRALRLWAFRCWFEGQFRRLCRGCARSSRQANGHWRAGLGWRQRSLQSLLLWRSHALLRRNLRALVLYCRRRRPLLRWLSLIRSQMRSRWKGQRASLRRKLTQLHEYLCFWHRCARRDRGCRVHLRVFRSLRPAPHCSPVVYAFRCWHKGFTLERRSHRDRFRAVVRGRCRARAAGSLGFWFAQAERRRYELAALRFRFDAIRELQRAVRDDGRALTRAAVLHHLQQLRHHHAHQHLHLSHPQTQPVSQPQPLALPEPQSPPLLLQLGDFLVLQAGPSVQSLSLSAAVAYLATGGEEGEEGGEGEGLWEAIAHGHFAPAHMPGHAHSLPHLPHSLPHAHTHPHSHGSTHDGSSGSGMHGSVSPVRRVISSAGAEGIEGARGMEVAHGSHCAHGHLLGLVSRADLRRMRGCALLRGSLLLWAGRHRDVQRAKRAAAQTRTRAAWECAYLVQRGAQTAQRAVQWRQWRALCAWYQARLAQEQREYAQGVRLLGNKWFMVWLGAYNRRIVNQHLQLPLPASAFANKSLPRRPRASPFVAAPPPPPQRKVGLGLRHNPPLPAQAQAQAQQGAQAQGRARYGRMIRSTREVARPPASAPTPAQDPRSTTTARRGNSMSMSISFGGGEDSRIIYASSASSVDAGWSEGGSGFSDVLSAHPRLSPASKEQGGGGGEGETSGGEAQFRRTYSGQHQWRAAQRDREQGRDKRVGDGGREWGGASRTFSSTRRAPS
ncbi:hypothetical protein B484DRAFT_443541 [Ochromonadaceae sp. CCMP2298]|nr:hypothetical protein B484DRAFT_443541 [Ochromonadaceae sp. CCMP2298]